MLNIASPAIYAEIHIDSAVRFRLFWVWIETNFELLYVNEDGRVRENRKKPAGNPGVISVSHKTNVPMTPKSILLYQIYY